MLTNHFDELLTHDEEERQDKAYIAECQEKINVLTEFKGTWIYKEIENLLNEKYNFLFNESLKDDLSGEQRVHRLEQFKGIAYAKNAVDILITQYTERLGE